VKTKQNFNVGRSEGKRVQFVIAGGAGATGVAWYAAPAPTSLPEERFAVMISPVAGLSMTDQGADLVVVLMLTPEQTEEFPVGAMHHELWATIDGIPERRSIGTMTVDDTLRN
jgi:hypothetical protein